MNPTPEQLKAKKVYTLRSSSKKIYWDKNEELYKKLSEKMAGYRDNEAIHICYDAIIENIAKHYEPEIVERLKEETKNIFWYA